MLPNLKRTVFVAKDISEQPPSNYILAINMGDKRGYYAVDDLTVDGNVVRFWGLDRVTLVFACKVDGAWSLFKRDLLETMTEEEYTRKTNEDNTELEKLSRELNPEIHAAMDKAKEIYLEEHGLSVKPPDGKVSREPGLYL